MSGKAVLFGNEARQALAKGAKIVSKAALISYGARGMVAAIESAMGCKVTKDGVSIAKAIELQDPFENLGASMIKEVSTKASDLLGDGTTTSICIANAIIEEGLKSVETGHGAMHIKTGLKKAADKVAEELKGMAQPCDTKERIAQVATISANNMRSVGDILASAMEAVGNNGAVHVTEGNAMEDRLEIVKGTRFDRGYTSPYFITNRTDSVCELIRPLICITKQKIQSLPGISHILENAAKSNMPILFLSEVSDEITNILVLNKMNGIIRPCVVNPPGFGDQKDASLEDLAVICGTTVIDEEVTPLNTIEPNMLGGADKIVITKDKTTIIGGKGSQESIKEREAVIQHMIRKTTSKYEKEKLEERLANLSGGVAVVHVGGPVESAMRERKQLVENAFNAASAAVSGGIVKGGALSLFHASKVLEGFKGDTPEENIGINIVRNAIQAPCKQIIKNAGIEETSSILEKITKSKNPNFGFDVAQKEYVDMFERGIIDAVKIIISALQYSVSVAGHILTTECAIVNRPTKDDGKKGVPGMDMDM